MARELVDTGNNELVINDAISRSTIALRYRLPSTEERVAFKRACLVRDGKKVRYDSNAARQKYGLEILTGFADGDFTVSGKPVSSDPASPNFHKGWKELVKATASDLVDVLALTVFEGISLGAAQAPIDFSDEQEAEADGLEKTPVESDTLEAEAGGEAEAPLSSNSGS